MNNKFENYLEALYYGDKGPLIIGLTGYTGSGCSTTKSILSQEEKIKLPGFQAVNSKKSPESNTQSERGQRIYEKLSSHWQNMRWEKFISIEASKIIFSFLLYEIIQGRISNSKYEPIKNYLHEHKNELELAGLVFFFDDVIYQNSKVSNDLIVSYENALKIYKYFKDSYDKRQMGEFIELLQNIGDEIRRYGKVTGGVKGEASPNNIYVLPKAMGRLIKGYQTAKEANRFVIDTLKNPYEIEYFKHKYSNFYVVGIIRNTLDRELSLSNILFKSDFEKIDSRERSNRYSKKKDNITEWITSQDIRECLGKADMYISNVESKSLAFAHLKYELVKLIALVTNPGCVPPTEDERCMQLAMTVRLSSGCISRQVGAVLIDGSRSVLGLGWNDPPQGQVPCALRTCGELTNNSTKEVFSTFERSPKFISHIQELNRPTKPFCFREELASFKTEPKQAEYTRALHAEENAMIQALFGGRKSLEGTTLYTTSSTCTLCAKKAYQLGVERIVYIDEYHDLAITQTIESGSKEIRLTLFSGITGCAYHKLYSSTLPEKTILNLYA